MNQQQIIEQAKFTYSPLGKAFEKQIKTIENQGEKRLKALEDLKTKGETKAIKDKHEEKNNQSSAAIIFNDLISTRKKIWMNCMTVLIRIKLCFEYVGPTKDVNFYEYMDSKELFHKIRNVQLKYGVALKNKKSC